MDSQGEGGLLLRVLDMLSEGAVELAEIAEVLMTSSYGTSARGLEYAMRKKRAQRAYRTTHSQDRQRAWNMLHRLRRDKLILERRDLFSLSKKGRCKLASLLAKSAIRRIADYQAIPSAELIMVSFDIPEAQRAKRNWLRLVLKHMGFSKIHASLWTGHKKLPRDFIDALAHMEIASHVEIFTVEKNGSLKAAR